MMMVSAETFQAIVDSLRTDQRRANEKRSKPRVGVSGKGMIRLEDGNFVTVAVRDLSQSGVGIVQHISWPPGKRFTLCFGSKLVAEQMKGIICEVVRCQRVADGIFSIGAKFIQHVTLSKDGSPSEPKRAKTIDQMMREFEQRRAASADASTGRAS
jgi:hypothetical protein